MRPTSRNSSARGPRSQQGRAAPPGHVATVPKRRAPPLVLALMERGPGETRVALCDGDGTPWEVHHLRDHDLMVGDIVLGRVKGQVPGGTAAFVDVGSAQDAFLPIEDCFPKADDGSAAKLPPQGSAVLVQVAIAARAEKGAKVTMALSLTPQGCADRTVLTYTPQRPGFGLSAKIVDKAERKRLQAWAAEAVQPGEGLVLRTRAWDAPEPTLTQALAAARHEWASLQTWAKQAKPPCRLRAAVDAEGGALGLALAGRLVDRVLCAGPGTPEAARAGCPDLADRITQTTSAGGLFAVEGIDEALEEALTSRVGALTIQQTAALTAIDVDSAGQTPEDANSHSVMEIARQIRLRNLAGMILIDFAAPRRGAEGHKRALADALAEALRDDPAGAQVLGVSRLGLVEVRRPRRGAPLADVLAVEEGPLHQAVPYSAETAALAALRAAASACQHMPGFRPLILGSSAIVAMLQGRLRAAVSEAERRLGDRLELDEQAQKPPSWWDLVDRRGREGKR